MNHERTRDLIVALLDAMAAGDWSQDKVSFNAAVDRIVSEVDPTHEKKAMLLQSVFSFILAYWAVRTADEPESIMPDLPPLDSIDYKCKAKNLPKLD